MIMFKGGVETQEYFSVEMSRAFEEHGYSVFWFDLVIGEQSARILRQFYEDRRQAEFVMFTFNFHGLEGEDGLYGSGYLTGSFWSDTDIPVYNMVVDHPLYYQQYIRFLPKRYTQLSIDRDHIRYMQRCFPSVNLGGELGFVPLGGTAVNADGKALPGMRYLPVKSRSMDIIFTGNYTPPQRLEKFLDGMDSEYRDFYHELVQEVIEEPDCLVEDIARRKLEKELGTAVSDSDMAACMPNMMFVDLTVRFYYRAKAVSALADSGIKIYTFGAGWDMLECRHQENIIQAGSVNSQECLDMMSQAKLSLNVMPWFKDGAHDRVFNAMLNGSVCVSDPSRYLKELFTDGRELAFYELSDIGALSGRVCELLSDEVRLQEMADCAYEKCICSHTWKNRAEQIIELIRRENKGVRRNL